MPLILLSAIVDGQATGECAFQVSIDGGPSISADTSIPGPAGIQIASGVHQLVVDANPTSPNHWPLTGKFQLQANGNLVTLDAPSEFMNPRSVSSGNDSIVLVSVHLSRLRDATESAFASLRNVPLIRSKPPPGSEKVVPDDWPPTVWNTPKLIDVHYVSMPPVDGGEIKISPLSRDPSTTDLVLELKNVNAPQTIAISWPDAVERTEEAGPTPFLVYFHSHVGQNAKAKPNYPAFPFYVHPQDRPYPFGFDYVYFGLWRYMNYLGDPLTAMSFTKGLPEEQAPFTKGLPYQMAAAGKNAVIVLPCNRVGPEVGVFLSAASMEVVLREIQAFMFRRAGIYTTPELGRTALASFSLGNGLVIRFLARPENQSHPFYLENLQELYMFEGFHDGNGSTAKDWVALARSWANRGSNSRKMIRAYTIDPVQGYDQLVGSTLPAGGPWIVCSSDNLRSAAVLPISAWNRAANKAGNANVAAGPRAYRDSHQLVSALMLRDALSRSGF